MSEPRIHSFIHCKACVSRGQTERIEAGLTGTGLMVQCKKHGTIGHFTPEQLEDFLAQGPQCECCRERGQAPGEGLQ